MRRFPTTVSGQGSSILTSVLSKRLPNKVPGKLLGEVPEQGSRKNKGSRKRSPHRISRPSNVKIDKFQWTKGARLWVAEQMCLTKPWAQETRCIHVQHVPNQATMGRQIHSNKTAESESCTESGWIASPPSAMELFVTEDTSVWILVSVFSL